MDFVEMYLNFLVRRHQRKQIKIKFPEAEKSRLFSFVYFFFFFTFSLILLFIFQKKKITYFKGVLSYRSSSSPGEPQGKGIHA